MYICSFHPQRSVHHFCMNLFLGTTTEHRPIPTFRHLRPVFKMSIWKNGPRPWEI